jgi:hypothetical protein
MADAGQTEQKFSGSGTQILAFGADQKGIEAAKSIIGSGDTESLTAFRIAGELRARQKQEGSDHAAAIRAARPETASRLTDNDIREMKLHFGAGRATEGANGKIELDTKDLSPELAAIVKNNSEAGMQIVDSLNDAVTYTSILSEFGQKNKTIEQILAERYPQKSEDERNQLYAAMREQTLDALLHTEAIIADNPELNSMSLEAQRDYLELLLAADPQLRKKIALGLQGIQDKLRSDLPEIKHDDEYKRAELAAASVNSQVNAQLVHAIDQLQRYGYYISEKDVTELRRDIVQKLNAGQSLEDITTFIQSDLIGKNDNYKKVNDYLTKHKGIRERIAEEETLIIRFAKDANLKADHVNIKDALKRELDELEKITGDADYAQWEKEVLQIKSVTSVQNNVGKFTSAFTQSLSDTFQSRQQLMGHIDTMNARLSAENKAVSDSYRERCRKESEIIAQADTVLGNAVADVYEARHTEALRLSNLIIDEKLRTAKTDAEKVVGKVAKERWVRIEHNTEKGRLERHPQIKNIEGDGRFLASFNTDQKDEAIKRLMLRDLGEKDYATIDFKDLDKEENKELKDKLDAAYQTFGESYEDAYILAYAQNRNKLHLQVYEKERVQQLFDGKMETAITANPVAKTLMEKIKASGIKIEGTQIKWLLYILAAILTAAAAFALLSNPATAAAIGAAVSGGALAVEHFIQAVPANLQNIPNQISNLFGTKG